MRRTRPTQLARWSLMGNSTGIVCSNCLKFELCAPLSRDVLWELFAIECFMLKKFNSFDLASDWQLTKPAFGSSVNELGLGSIRNFEGGFLNFAIWIQIRNFRISDRFVCNRQNRHANSNLALLLHFKTVCSPSAHRTLVAIELEGIEKLSTEINKIKQKTSLLAQL